MPCLVVDLEQKFRVSSFLFFTAGHLIWSISCSICRDKFTIDIHHGGFFVGSGHLKSYIDERVSWFDRVEADTFSPLWFPDFAPQLGY